MIRGNYGVKVILDDSEGDVLEIKHKTNLGVGGKNLKWSYYLLLANTGENRG